MPDETDAEQRVLLGLPTLLWRRYRLGERRPFARTDETAETADKAMIPFLRSAE